MKTAIKCEDCRLTKNVVRVYNRFVCGVCIETVLREIAEDRAALLAAKNALVRGLWANPFPCPTYSEGTGI